MTTANEWARWARGLFGRVSYFQAGDKIMAEVLKTGGEEQESAQHHHLLGEVEGEAVGSRVQTGCGKVSLKAAISSGSKTRSQSIICPITPGDLRVIAARSCIVNTSLIVRT